MLLKATQKRVRYRSQDGQEIVLPPGVPTEVEERHAVKILEQARDKVRQVLPSKEAHIPSGCAEPATGTKQACDYQADGAVIEPALRPDGSPLSPIYWERAVGEIAGPGQPEFFAKIGRGATDRDFWIIATHNGDPTWIRADMLRSKQQWATQKPVVSVDGFAARA